MGFGFVGRVREVRQLSLRLERAADTGRGVAVSLRGRRQVGKSRLAQELCDRAAVPYCFFAASKGTSVGESLRRFTEALDGSTLPRDRALVPDNPPSTWADAFALLAAILPDGPCVVVLDEVPWLSEQDPAFDGALQTAWDRLLSAHPVLLVLLGSDVHMMERMTTYDHPLFGRTDPMELGPLDLGAIASALDLGPADTIDAALISGGLPGILRTWPARTSALDFLRREVDDPAAPVFTLPEASLMAELPAPALARAVIEAIGSGNRTQATIAAAAGRAPVPSGTLSPLLRRLVEVKRILAIDVPLSTVSGKPALYRVADSNLRFYLEMRQAHELSRRGRPDAATRLIERRWAAWRGRAVEPLVRESLVRAAEAGELPWPGVGAVGGWWNRSFEVEVDLVGTDRPGVAQDVLFVGSTKWRASPVDSHDVDRLRWQATRVPGAPQRCPLVLASLAGPDPRVARDDVQLWWGPEQVCDSLAG